MRSPTYRPRKSCCPAGNTHLKDATNLGLDESLAAQASDGYDDRVGVDWGFDGRQSVFAALSCGVDVMRVSRVDVYKGSVGLPADLVAFADEQARRLKISRSQFVSQALYELKAREEARLAAAGYRFYADEARRFAEVSGNAVAESFDGERRAG